MDAVMECRMPMPLMDFDEEAGLGEIAYYIRSHNQDVLLYRVALRGAQTCIVVYRCLGTTNMSQEADLFFEVESWNGTSEFRRLSERTLLVCEKRRVWM